MFGKWKQVIKYDEKGRGVCKHDRQWHGCPDCRKERPGPMRAWRTNNPDKALQQQLNKYGVTVEWYQAQEAKQNNCCAICNQPEVARRNGKRKRLAVDHNHVTGEPRALLCTVCNTSVGILENLPWVLKAKQYLATFSSNVCLSGTLEVP